MSIVMAGDPGFESREYNGSYFRRGEDQRYVTQERHRTLVVDAQRESPTVDDLAAGTRLSFCAGFLDQGVMTPSSVALTLPESSP